MVSLDNVFVQNCVYIPPTVIKLIITTNLKFIATQNNLCNGRDGMLYRFRKSKSSKYNKIFFLYILQYNLILQKICIIELLASSLRLLGTVKGIFLVWAAPWNCSDKWQWSRTWTNLNGSYKYGNIFVITVSFGKLPVLPSLCEKRYSVICHLITSWLLSIKKKTHPLIVCL